MVNVDDKGGGGVELGFEVELLDGLLELSAQVDGVEFKVKLDWFD
ncbi:MAG: Uncharacterised protein [Cryomorphaceae bacterium]|nr:MAG: Uncharacterised protein [Cryomorphaceae bacterium]